MKNLLYVTDALAIHGGLERVLIDKANWLSTRGGYGVYIVTTNQGGHSLAYPLDEKVIHLDLQIGFNIQYKYSGINRLIYYERLRKLFSNKLSEIVKQIKPDIIICARIDFLSEINNVKGCHPVVFESHSSRKAYSFDGSGYLHKIRVRLMQQTVKNVQKIVALSNGDANEWMKLNKKTCVIPNIVHLNDTGSYTNCQNRSVIFVSRFSLQKDISILLKVWEIIYKKHPDWQLEMFGDGELKDSYFPVIKEMNANVTVHEQTAQIIEEYKRNSILLLTSLFEPFGLVLPEAMSCGLPVVAFDCPYGPADIITDGVDGFLIKDRNIEAFADKVCQLIENKDLRRRMGQNGIISSQRYRADVIMPKWISLFEELTSGQ
jgi:glycosyltransferase involved in cell wall biosynthesis